MTTPTPGTLVTQSELVRAVESGETPEWITRHWQTFYETLTGERDGESFPCYFGANSVREGEPLYTVVPSLTEPASVFGLRDALVTYLDTYEGRSGRASLVTFFEPTDRLTSEADYHERLWHVLETLHVYDPAPWPDDIPTETDDPEWEFCFGGEPIFPTCRAPFYDTYVSRHCPVGLEITFQPRALFDGITADTPAGEQARETIRSNLEAYDGVCPHANLGDWGVEGDREWHQYLLPETDEESPDSCPVSFSREHPKAVSADEARRFGADWASGENRVSGEPETAGDHGSVRGE